MKVFDDTKKFGGRLFILMLSRLRKGFVIFLRESLFAAITIGLRSRVFGEFGGRFMGSRLVFMHSLNL